MHELDTDLVRRRRNELALTREELARRTGLAWIAIESLEDHGYMPNFTLESLGRLARALGVTPQRLLLPREAPEPTPDITILGSVLARHRDGVNRSRLLTGLEWTASRLENAIRALDRHLEIAGQTVHHTSTEIRLVPGTESPQNADIVRAEREVEPLTTDQARVLLKTIRATNREAYWDDYTQPEQHDLRTLIAHGIIEEDARRVRLTHAAGLSLDTA